jgi:hypothetical protein
MFPLKMEWEREVHSNSRLLALPANIKLGWKRMSVVNALAYYIPATITTVKSFILQGPML